jgi:hypothetical protein
LGELRIPAELVVDATVGVVVDATVGVFVSATAGAPNVEPRATANPRDSMIAGLFTVNLLSGRQSDTYGDHGATRGGRASQQLEVLHSLLLKRGGQEMVARHRRGHFITILCLALNARRTACASPLACLPGVTG